MLPRLSKTFKGPRLLKRGVREVDVGDDVKVPSSNPDEIIVDFLENPFDIKLLSVKPEEILEDFPSHSTRNVLRDERVTTGTMSGNNDNARRTSSFRKLRRKSNDTDCSDDADEEGFLGFPKHARERSFVRRKSSYGATMSSRSLGASKEVNETSTSSQFHIEIPPVNGRKSSYPSKRCGSIDEKLVVDTDDDCTEDPDVLDENDEVFEKPSNWVDSDDDSDSVDSEEYRRQIIRMTRQRQDAEEAEFASPLLDHMLNSSTGSKDQERSEHRSSLQRSQRRMSNHCTTRRCSMNFSTTASSDDDENDRENPFSAGFEFAKQAPLPSTNSATSRRPTMTHKKERNERATRMLRRASMPHTQTSEYTDGLRAFGAKTHDIHRLINN